MKKICKEQYEKDFKEMFKLGKNGLMTDIDCYVSNLENKINNLQSKIDKAIEFVEKSMNNPQPFYEYLFGDENGKVENLDRLLDILKEEK